MRTCVALLAAGILALPVLAAADRGADLDPWSDGDVRVDLRVAGGSGSVVQLGAAARISLRVDADAYVAVYAIDTQGEVRLLFPRFWREDGWLEAGETLRLDERGFASRLMAELEPGIVYLQAVASPVPFDWRRTGLVATDLGCEWWSAGRPLRIQGDPLLGCNDVNQLLFPDWEDAVFAAGTAWYYVGHECAHPAYLCGVCAGRHRGYHEPWSQVRVQVSWDWERARRHCRPLYHPLFVYHSDRRVLRHAGPDFESRFSPGDRSPSPAEGRRREVSIDAPRRERDAAVETVDRVERPRARQLDAEPVAPPRSRPSTSERGPARHRADGRRER